MPKFSALSRWFPLALLIGLVVACTPAPAAPTAPPTSPPVVVVTSNPAQGSRPTRTPTRPTADLNQIVVQPTNSPLPTLRPTTAPTKVAVQPTHVNPLNCKIVLVGGKSPSSLPKMKYEDLTACRPEVGQTLRGIISGNFPYSKDDTTFQNRERILPAVSGSQSYREYTVRTPGESDRGARRIVTSGAESRRSANYTTLYYTDDHYDSFWIVEKPAS